MLKLGRFLGFTDEMKEPRKTRAEDELSKLYRYHNVVYNSVEYLCTKILEGYKPEKEENCCHYKANGELSKPKTEYRLLSPDYDVYHTYNEINKTQYDFVTYVIEKGLITEEKMMAYDAEDVRKNKEKIQADIEAKKREEEEAKRKELEKEEFEEWMYEESKLVPKEQKELVNKIFIDIYGKESIKGYMNYSLIPCINNFDNPLCKQEVIDRLNNYNKASIKIFECMTGLKLPNTYRERVKFLKGLTKADFKESSQYKENKKNIERDR